jgi:hypothetical protein
MCETHRYGLRPLKSPSMRKEVIEELLSNRGL